MWGDAADNFDKGKIGKVVAVKGASVREFNGGYSLTTSQYVGCSMLFDNLPVDAVRPLVAWYEQKKDSPSDFKSLAMQMGGSTSFESNYRLIGSVLNHFGVRGELADSPPIYINACATIMNVTTENAIYKACPKDGCSKKLVEESGRYRCAKCGESPNFKYNFKLEMEVADFSGSAFLTLWKTDLAERILGIKSEQMAEMRESDPAKYAELFHNILFHTFEFRISIRQDVFNEQNRIRWSVVDILPVNAVKMISLYRKALSEEEGVTV